MNLSEQAEKVLKEIENIEVPEKLVYPVTDMSLNPLSWKVFQDGPFLDLKGGTQVCDWYLSECISDTKALMQDMAEFIKTHNSL